LRGQNEFEELLASGDLSEEERLGVLPLPYCRWPLVYRCDFSQLIFRYQLFFWGNERSLPHMHEGTMMICFCFAKEGKAGPGRD